ncbi:hypothetical protein J5N97_026877 [Dioscorea zingiberensis]|uniref:Clu domain-containing protein n=1 Tax=Dioscorea zingiberensis TaxID=325984 RepID=A0A9D5C3Y0_9LILI|nr:hypothetical protein J5N97_026877 [Dioscorea zingiberensis]
MAPKAGKAKPHKTKGEKKKKEEKVLPTVVDITVETPDYTQLTLKGISTDRILDIRKLLAVHVDTCHLTNYSLSHEVRGSRLKDNVEIVALKPCHVTIVDEEYTEELAVGHVRRLLDIVACTTAFASKNGSPRAGSSPKDPDAHAGGAPDSAAKAPSKSPRSPRAASSGGIAGGSGGQKDEPMYPPPKLGQFYDFFSFAHLSPPFQYLRRSSKPFVEDKREDDFFQIDFGNLPYGFRANTWVVPPLAADSPSVFPPLPIEDENWGGNGGGQGKDGKHDKRQWAREFSILAAMPCKTAEERQIRDRKAFLVHSLFVDVAVLRLLRGYSEPYLPKSLRMLLHKSTSQSSGLSPHTHCTDDEDLQTARSLVQKVLADSLMKLEEAAPKQRKSIRWELGACWVQHLQNQDKGKTEPKKTEEAKVEPAVKGLGKQFGQLKEIKKKTDEKGVKTDPGGKENPSCNGSIASKTNLLKNSDSKELDKQNVDKELVLQKVLPEAAFLRLKESETGLHLKSPEELIDMAHKFYEDTALPKLSKQKLGSEDLRTLGKHIIKCFDDGDSSQYLFLYIWKLHLNGTPKPDASIASKGHLSVSDLLDYINPDTELKAREMQRKLARAKIKGRMGQNQWETVEDDDQKDTPPVSDYLWKENSSDKENNNQIQPVEAKVEKPISTAVHFLH